MTHIRPFALLDKLSKASYFEALDLKSGFGQVPVHSDDTKKFAFIMPLGLHEYLRIPKGYRNATLVFMRLIITLIDQGNLRVVTMAFINNLTVHRPTWSAYHDAQICLLIVLQSAQWLITADELYLGCDIIKVLGHIVKGLFNLTH